MLLQVWQQVKAANPGFSICEIGATIGRMWRELADEEKQRHMEDFNKDKVGTTTITVLRPFFRDHPGEPLPEENFWTLWRKGRLTEADTQTIRLGGTPSGLSSAHLQQATEIL